MLVCSKEITHLSLFLSVSYKTFLSEDAGPDTLVAIVHANDPDGDGVSYAITGGNEDSNFLLDNQKGKGAAAGVHKMCFFFYVNTNKTAST